MDTQVDSNGDGKKDLDTAVLREVGCGVIYLLEFEDTEETGYQVALDREEAEKTYAVLGKMLGKTQAPVLPPARNVPDWRLNPCTVIPPNTHYPQNTMPGGLPWPWPKFPGW